MKFTAAVVLALATTASAFAPPAFAPRTTVTRIFQSTEAAASETETEEPQKLSKKQERLRMMESDRFYRKGFKDTREASEKTMNEQFESTIVKDLKTNNYVMERDGVKVYLAKVCRPPECSIMRCIAMYSKFSSRLSFRYTGSSTQGLA
jgi:4-hydroxy-3-methylbut-2-enyl diphosphate reductase